MRRHNLRQTLNIQSAVVTLNIRSRASKANNFCLQTMNQCKFGVGKFTCSEDRAQKRNILQFFMESDHDNVMTLKTRLKSPISYQLFILPQCYNT